MLPILQISSLIFSFLFNSKECLYVLKLIIGKTIAYVVGFSLHGCEKLPTFVQKIGKIYRIIFNINLYLTMAYLVLLLG
jgi:hypothetical protein